MNDNGPGSSTTKDELTESCRAAEPDTDSQESSTPEAQGEIQTKDCRPPPSSGVDASKPAVPSSTTHDNQIRDISGCERTAEEDPMPQDDQGRIERVGAEHKKKPVVIATAVTRAAHCQFPGCDRTPRYGTQVGHLNFCQAHKRAGQYAVRNCGEVFVATRDGSAFRDNPGTAAAGAASETGVGSASAAATTLPQDVNALLPTSGSAVSTLSKNKVPKKKKNRPCIFPGCDIRPHYGLVGGRPLYCVTHKEDEMVHLLRAAKNLEKEAQSRSRVNSRLRVAESEGGLEPENNEDPTQKDHELASAKDTSGHIVERSAELKSSAKEGLLLEKTAEAKDQQTSTKPSPASALEKGSTRNTEVQALPPSGLAPSDEIRLLQEARESARAAVEASGSGRRPRAPSRKLLEASGKLMCDSIQWMTKEKRAEEARFKQEMKEQRKAAAAAGLKFGHRMEALALSAPVDARVEENGAVTNDGETANATAWTGIKAAATSAFWRKLTPAETLMAAGKQPSGDGAQLDTPASKVLTTEAAGIKTTGVGRRGQETSDAPAAVAKAGVPERKRKVVASADGSTSQAQGARRCKYSRQARRRAEGGDRKGPAE